MKIVFVCMGSQCNIPYLMSAPIVNGTSGWTSWNPCSVSCGSGERMRTIACLGIPRNGGYGCENVSSAMQFERHPCQMPECDGKSSKDVITH